MDQDLFDTSISMDEPMPLKFDISMQESKEDDDDWGDDDDDWGDVANSGEDWGEMEKNVGEVHCKIVEEVKQSYQILDTSQLNEIRCKDINEIIDALFPEMPKSEAKDMAISLLQQQQWNKAKVMNAFCDDSEKAMQVSGITPMKVSGNSPAGGGDLFECPQCLDDVPYNQSFSLKCNHQSCRQCWENYLIYQSRQGDAGVIIKCNYAGCNLVVPESAWNRILPQDLMVKRQKFVTDHFVRCRKDVVWCPGADCTLAVRDPMRDAPDVKCTCGSIYCFKCQENFHRPCPCDWAKNWRIKCSSEAENANWILANTKKCPKCHAQIEKNQGCNHMSCRSCKHEFCWLCKEEWSKHGTSTGGYYRCNRYEEKVKEGGKSDEETKALDAKTELQRYLHYYKRFENHEKARKFAEKSFDERNDRMKRLQELKGGGFNDVSFIDDAVKTVIECRRLLQWTYAQGYYMKPKTREKNLFEHLQEELEKNTEHLHELSEKPLEDLISVEVRASIINYTRVTNKFRENLTKGIEEGLIGDC